MTGYRLRDDLSFCLVDGHPILLDVGSDRYFRLSGRTELAFCAYAQGHCSEADLDHLVEQALLTAGPRGERAPAVITSAEQSILELSSQHDPLTASTYAKVLGLVCWTKYELKTRKLKDLLARASSLRHRIPNESSDADRLTRAAMGFLAVRNLVPLERCCLLDSLAMALFLGRHGLPAHIVFGVATDPFAAHCWVQSGNIVLNDTLGNTRSHTVIGVF